MNKVSIAVLALIGMASAFDITKHFNTLTKCKVGDNSTCAENQHCNEMGYCVAGAPSKLQKARPSYVNFQVRNEEDEDDELIPCASNEECFEAFKSTKFHCNEFNNCIPGAPYVPPTVRYGEKQNHNHENEEGAELLKKCESNADCFVHYNSGDWHCNEYNNCLPGAPYMPSRIEMLCESDSDCPNAMHCLVEEQACVPHGL